MLELKDIDVSVDYDELCFIESHLMHEVKRRGTLDFVKTYSENIEQFRRDWSKINFCYLLALLEYLDPTFKYDSSIKLSKFVLDAYSYGDLVDFNEELDYNKLYNNSIISFRSRGFLFDEIGKAF